MTDATPGESPEPGPDRDCVFCRIVAGEVPAQVLARTERVLAFADLDPQAPVHALVIPRAHHQDVAALAAADAQTLADLVAVGAGIAGEQADGSFRLVFNSGAAAGQSVAHVHGHVLAGRSLTWPPG